MISLAHPPQFSILPINFPISRRNFTCDAGVFLPPNSKIKRKCFAADHSQSQPQNQNQKKSQRPRKKTQPLDGDKKDGIDPVGFLSKHGITDKAFAQFLRER